MSAIATPVPIEQWGRDHWGVFAYVETVCVNGRYQEGIGRVGKPDHRKIQTNVNRHPFMDRNLWTMGTEHDGSDYPIRLQGGLEIPGPDYDEWDCLEDCEEEGLIKNVGTGINPLFVMTEEGNQVAALLRQYMSEGGSIGSFSMPAGRCRHSPECTRVGTGPYGRCRQHEDEFKRLFVIQNERGMPFSAEV